jgi:hypothetical protein
MLDKTTSYHVPTLMQPPVKTVTGRYLAHGKLSKPERAVLAADLLLLTVMALGSSGIAMQRSRDHSSA